MEVPGLGVESGLQLPVYATAQQSQIGAVSTTYTTVMAMPDPYSTEWDKGSNLHPHGYQSGSLLLSHNGCFKTFKF